MTQPSVIIPINYALIIWIILNHIENKRQIVNKTIKQYKFIFLIFPKSSILLISIFSDKKYIHRKIICLTYTPPNSATVFPIFISLESTLFSLQPSCTTRTAASSFQYICFVGDERKQVQWKGFIAVFCKYSPSLTRIKRTYS